jgi:hypothetical protein
LQNSTTFGIGQNTYCGGHKAGYLMCLHPELQKTTASGCHHQESICCCNYVSVVLLQYCCICITDQYLCNVASIYRT